MDDRYTTCGWFWTMLFWYLFVASVWYGAVLRPLARWSRLRSLAWASIWPVLYVLICASQLKEWLERAIAWVRR